MRLDHIAYRVADRHQTVKFLKKMFGYEVQEEFCVDFNNGEQAKCFALRPPEKPRLAYGAVDTHRFSVVTRAESVSHCYNIYGEPVDSLNWREAGRHMDHIVYHLAPEIFVSDGTPDSIVGRWVANRDGVGGIHHLAYEVPSVSFIMKEFICEDLAKFTTSEPIKSKTGDLIQVFTEVHPLTGVIYEFIERRGARGFNVDNVKDLMLSTDEREDD